MPKTVNIQLLTVSKLSRLQREILEEFKKGQWYGNKYTGGIEQALRYTDVVIRIAEKRNLYRSGIFGDPYIDNENSLRSSVSRSLRRLVSRGLLEKNQFRFYDDTAKKRLLWREYRLTSEGLKYLESRGGA